MEKEEAKLTQEEFNEFLLEFTKFERAIGKLQMVIKKVDDPEAKETLKGLGLIGPTYDRLKRILVRELQKQYLR